MFGAARRKEEREAWLFLPRSALGSTEVKSRHQTQPTPQTNLSPTSRAPGLLSLPPPAATPGPGLPLAPSAAAAFRRPPRLGRTYTRPRIRPEGGGRTASRRFLAHAHRICVWLPNFRARYRKVRSHRLPARPTRRTRSSTFASGGGGRGAGGGGKATENAPAGARRPAGSPRKNIGGIKEGAEITAFFVAALLRVN